MLNIDTGTEEDRRRIRENVRLDSEKHECNENASPRRMKSIEKGVGEMESRKKDWVAS